VLSARCAAFHQQAVQEERLTSAAFGGCGARERLRIKRAQEQQRLREMSVSGPSKQDMEKLLRDKIEGSVGSSSRLAAFRLLRGTGPASTVSLQDFTGFLRHMNLYSDAAVRAGHA
jgi:hypothetical protein